MGGVRAGGVATQAIGHALGARFLVDGALLRLDDRWRLDIQMTTPRPATASSPSATHAPRRRPLPPRRRPLRRARGPRLPGARAPHPPGALGRNPQDLAAWELAHHAMDLCATRDHGANATAAVSFEQAITRDPLLVLAHFGRGLAAYDAVLNQWGDVDHARARLAEAAEQCVAVAPHGAEGHYLRARYSRQTRGGDHPHGARARGRHEPELRPGPRAARPGAAPHRPLRRGARPHAPRAAPAGPRGFVAGLANLHWMRHEYAEALAAAETAIASAPRYTFARVLAAVSAHHLGERARAADHLARLKADYPPFDARSFRLTFGAGDRIRSCASASRSRPWARADGRAAGRASSGRRHARRLGAAHLVGLAAAHRAPRDVAVESHAAAAAVAPWRRRAQPVGLGAGRSGEMPGRQKPLPSPKVGLP